MLFFVSNAIEGQLVSTGAFEVSFNGVYSETITRCLMGVQTYRPTPFSGTIDTPALWDSLKNTKHTEISCTLASGLLFSEMGVLT